jgi:hypothetical protein
MVLDYAAFSAMDRHFIKSIFTAIGMFDMAVYIEQRSIK